MDRENERGENIPGKFRHETHAGCLAVEEATPQGRWTGGDDDDSSAQASDRGVKAGSLGSHKKRRWSAEAPPNRRDQVGHREKRLRETGIVAPKTGGSRIGTSSRHLQGIRGYSRDNQSDSAFL